MFFFRIWIIYQHLQELACPKQRPYLTLVLDFVVWAKLVVLWFSLAAIAR
jgi:hypothetical protein